MRACVRGRLWRKVIGIAAAYLIAVYSVVSALAVTQASLLSVGAPAGEICHTVTGDNSVPSGNGSHDGVEKCCGYCTAATGGALVPSPADTGIVRVAAIVLHDRALVPVRTERHSGAIRSRAPPKTA